MLIFIVNVTSIKSTTLKVSSLKFSLIYFESIISRIIYINASRNITDMSLFGVRVYTTVKGYDTSKSNIQTHFNLNYTSSLFAVLKYNHIYDIYLLISTNFKNMSTKELQFLSLILRFWNDTKNILTWNTGCYG